MTAQKFDTYQHGQPGYSGPFIDYPAGLRLWLATNPGTISGASPAACLASALALFQAFSGGDYSAISASDFNLLLADMGYAPIGKGGGATGTIPTTFALMLPRVN